MSPLDHDKSPSLAMRISPRSRFTRRWDRTPLREPFRSDSDTPSSSPPSPSPCMNGTRRPSDASSSPSLLSRLAKSVDSEPTVPICASPRSLLDRIGDFTTDDSVEETELAVADDPLDIVLEDDLVVDCSRSIHPTAEHVPLPEISWDGEIPATTDATTAESPSSAIQHDMVDMTMTASPTEPAYFSSGSEAAVDGLLQFTGSDVEMEDPDVVNHSAPISVPISPRIEPADQPPSTLPKSPPSVFDQCRTALLPVVLQNAKLRDGCRDPPTEDEIGTQLTDERCAHLMAKAKEVREQLAIRQERKESLAGSSSGIVKDYGNKGNEGDAWTTARMGKHLNVPSDVVYRSDGEILPVNDFSPAPTATGTSPPKAPKAMRHATKTRTTETPSSSRRLLATPMRELPDTGKRRKLEYQGGWSHREHYSSQSGYTDKSPVLRERPRPLFSSPPPPYAEQTQTIPNPLDPQFLMSSETKPPRRGSIDDVHSVSTPSNDSSQLKNTRQYDIAHSTSYSHSVQDQSTSLHQDEATRHDPPASPRLPIPGLWFAKVGLSQADIIDTTFEIEPALGFLDDNHGLVKGGSTDKPTVSLHILCLPINAVSSTSNTFDHSTTPETIASAMWAIKTHWPSGGKLVVEVNHGQIYGRSWLPIDLDLAAGPAIDVTDHLRSGTNSIRFIQLADLSEYVFVLHASKEASAEMPSLDDTVERQAKDPTTTTTATAATRILSLSSSGVLDESEMTSSIKLDGFLTELSLKLKEKAGVCVC